MDAQIRQPSHRRPRSRLAVGAVAVLVALAAVPLAVGPVAAATVTQYVANCPVNLRASSSTDSAVLDVIATNTVVTVSDEVSGEPYSADCNGTVSGTHWFVVTAVGGKSVSSLYGVSVVYAASELFFAAGMLEGVDVSGWQGAVDYDQVAAAGRRFVIAKATEGIGFTDSKWARNRTYAPAAGLALGGYHFARPDLNPNDPAGEADWFVSQLGLVPGMLIPALDLEKSGGLSKSALTAWVGAWLQEVYAKTGVRAMIYTSPAFWKSYLGDTTAFADAGYRVLWIAHWFVSSPRVPANNWGGRGWTFWQYDNSGTVPGIDGRVDLDRYNGLDLTPVTFGADFALAASSGTATTVSTTGGTASMSVEQGASASVAVQISRTFFTLPVVLGVSGLPAGTTATFSPSSTTGGSATLTVTTSNSGTATPVGSYQLAITGTANGLTRTTTATLTVTDGLPPTVAAPASRLFAATTLGSTTAPVRTSWSASDPSGVGGYGLQRQTDGGAWTTVSLATATTTSRVDSLAFGHAYRFRVLATDRLDNTSGWAYGPTFKPLLTQQSSSALSWSGGWKTIWKSSASGGSYRTTATKGAWASFRFSGSSIAWVAPRGPTRGAAAVYVDGKYVAKVSLYSSTYKARQVVFAYNWASNGTHTIKVVCLGTSGHPRIDLDAFVRLYRV
jgi:GH25 family lysozyme M1 (1,4-beta-N-acetylmuramidase)